MVTKTIPGVNTQQKTNANTMKNAMIVVVLTGMGSLGNTSVQWVRGKGNMKAKPQQNIKCKCGATVTGRSAEPEGNGRNERLSFWERVALANTDLEMENFLIRIMLIAMIFLLLQDFIFDHMKYLSSYIVYDADDLEYLHYIKKIAKDAALEAVKHMYGSAEPEAAAELPVEA